MCSATVEWRPTLAQNVRSPLVKQETWRRTCWPTQGRKYTNVQNVEIHFIDVETWNSTCSSTVGRSHTSAHNAIIHQHIQVPSEFTSKHILYKSRNNANRACILQSQNRILQNICSSTLERSHITVKSVGDHSPRQDIWKGTSQFTPEKNHKDAHIVVTQVLYLLISNDTWPGTQKQLTSFVLRQDDHNLNIDCPWPF